MPKEPSHRGSSPAWLFSFLGALSLAGYWVAAVRLETSGSATDVHHFLLLFGGLFAVYFIAAALSPRWRSNSSWLPSVQIIIWALLFRLAMLPAGLPTDTWIADLVSDVRSQEVSYRSFLLYDNDVWRYLWDGHVFSHGIDPFSASPAELERRMDAEDPQALALFEDELWQDVFDRISYETYQTVYPPAAQTLFRLAHQIAPGSIFTWKLLLILFDLGTCLVLVLLLRSRRHPPATVLIYAWNPLLIKEVAGSGHVDALMIFFLVLAVYWIDRGWERSSLLAFGLAILSKLIPILLLPLFLRRAHPRHWWVLGATLAAGYIPFAHSLETMFRATLAFGREWVFNPGPWLLVFNSAELLGLPGHATASLVSLAVTGALVAWATIRDDKSINHLITAAMFILGGFLVFSAAVMPWYLLWVLPLAVSSDSLSGQPTSGQLASRPFLLAWAVLTGLSLLSYQIYIDQIEHRWWLWVEYLGFFAVLGLASARLRARESGALENSNP